MNHIGQGCLLIADISGYSQYLGGVELDHAQDILADLLDDIVANTSVLALAKLEGDAVFCHAPTGTLEGSDLVDSIESCYFSFCSRRRNIKQLTTCPCDACRRIEDLDLKFIVHYGEYALHTVAGREELVGQDVILVHRLLKNSVAEEVGTHGYALFTQGAVAELDLEAFAAELPAIDAVVDDGLVGVRVQDLVARWRQQQEQNVVVEHPSIDVWVDVEAAPSEIWRIMSSPHERPHWVGISTGVDQHNDRGIPGVGTINHCAHGDQPATTDEIVDWKPFDHYTFTTTTRSSGNLLLVTHSLEPINETTTRIRHRFAEAEGHHPISPETADRHRPVAQADLERLAELVLTRRATP